MLMDYVQDARRKDEKLVLIVGEPGSGKSKMLRSLADNRGWKYMSCNEILTSELLELVPKVRSQEAPQIIDKTFERCGSEVYLLDGMHALFAPFLQLDPLELIRRLSRRHMIVAAWPGTYEDGRLCFEYNSGLPDAPRTYEVGELSVVQL